MMTENRQIQREGRGHWKYVGDTGLLAERNRATPGDCLPRLRKRSTCEPLDMSNVSMRHPSGHQAGRIVQSIHHLLCSGESGAEALRPWSCELPRRLESLSSGCISLPPTSSRRSLGSLSSQTSSSRQLSGQSTPVHTSSGCASVSCPSLPHAASLGCPAVPGLAWKSQIGSGSFARVYSGEYHGREVAVKVMSSRDKGADYSSDLFESLVSANMHHPNVVKTFEVLTVQQQPEGPFLSSCKSSFCRNSSDVGISRPGQLPASQEAAELDNLVSFFGSHRVQEQPPLETLAASNPQSSAGVSAFAASQCAFAPTAAAAKRASKDLSAKHSSPSLRLNELRGILRREGPILASRSASNPLPLSPFDAALCQAEVEAGGTCAGGRQGSAAASALFGIQRHSFDAAARPRAEVNFRRSSADAPGNSLASVAISSWSGSSSSSGGTDGGGSPPSARSPLPEPPQPPQLRRQPQVLLLMELADRRSLHYAISRGRLSRDMEAILLCAMDVASGMAYLHSLGVVHADLKPGNVLLMSAPITADDPRGFTCKIADFGMARLLASGSSHAETDDFGSLPFVAPEVLQRGELAKPADVYSFAVLLLEMWSGGSACAGESLHGVLYSAFYGGRPRVPDDTPSEYRALLQSCWAADPAQRPSFAAVHCQLASMLAAARARRPNQATPSPGRQ